MPTHTVISSHAISRNRHWFLVSSSACRTRTMKVLSSTCLHFRNALQTNWLGRSLRFISWVEYLLASPAICTLDLAMTVADALPAVPTGISLDEVEAQHYTWKLYGSAALSLCANLLAFYVILFHSPKSMALYRWCLLDIAVCISFRLSQTSIRNHLGHIVDIRSARDSSLPTAAIVPEAAYLYNWSSAMVTSILRHRPSGGMRTSNKRAGHTRANLMWMHSERSRYMINFLCLLDADHAADWLLRGGDRERVRVSPAVHLQLCPLDQKTKRCSRRRFDALRCNAASSHSAGIGIAR